MKALDRKLYRDLWRLRSQVVSIAIVIGSGVAVLVMSVSTLDALEQTTAAYYDRYRFGEVFSGGTRVPERVAGRIAAISGVQTVETRIARYATLDIADFSEPVIGRLTSIPGAGQPALNQLALRSGRWVSAHRHDEVILNEPFAQAHGLAPGDRFRAIINGHRRALTVVGTALSPEFIYALGPGALMADDKRFGIVWMSREALGAAFDLEGAFNDVSLTLLRGAATEPVIAELDRLLERYGGSSAIPRADQLSNWFVMNEIAQLRTMAVILPTIFLIVAAFLTHMVLGRLIATERTQIGLLKAFGYGELQISWHYVKMVLVIALLGTIGGWLFGVAFGRYQTELYAELFRFPLLIYRPGAQGFLVAGGVSTLAALIGAMSSVRRAAALPPAEAMQPPAPVVYNRGRFGLHALAAMLDQPTRIALRQIMRWPVRAALTTAGVAIAIGLLVMALQWNDAIDYIAHSYFFDAQHQDMTVGLAEPQETTVLHEFGRLPGVRAAEPLRYVAADFTVATTEHRGTVTGIPRGATLQPIYDELAGANVAIPGNGLVLSSYLARKLGVGVGDEVFVEVLEGRRPSGSLPVAAVFETLIGMPAYMDLDALNRFLRVRPMVGYVNLLVDPVEETALYARLKELPAVGAIMLRRAAIDTFNETIAEHLLVYITLFTGFACALAFGVTYNSTRIALSERGRELATLRVLGFTRGEISYILLGEVGLLIVAALPLGCVAGRELVFFMARAFDTELFRLPMVIEPATYGLSVLFALAATALSAALVRRRIDRLDLIRVLKTRE